MGSIIRFPFLLQSDFGDCDLAVQQIGLPTIKLWQSQAVWVPAGVLFL